MRGKLSVNLTSPFSAVFDENHGKHTPICLNSIASVGKTYSPEWLTHSKSLEGVGGYRNSAVSQQNASINRTEIFAVLRGWPDRHTAPLPHNQRGGM